MYTSIKDTGNQVFIGIDKRFGPPDVKWDGMPTNPSKLKKFKRKNYQMFEQLQNQLIEFAQALNDKQNFKGCDSRITNLTDLNSSFNSSSIENKLTDIRNAYKPYTARIQNKRLELEDFAKKIESEQQKLDHRQNKFNAYQRICYTHKEDVYKLLKKDLQTQYKKDLKSLDDEIVNNKRYFLVLKNNQGCS